jgi:amidase
MKTEFWRDSATRVAYLVRTKEVSAREIAIDALERLEAVNGHINAVVDYRPELVLAAADAVDQRLAKGDDPGPLAGVPVTVKAVIDQVGFATTNGATILRDLMATENSPIVNNLERSGAVILGRTNTPAFAYRWFTSNKLYGATLNPHDPALTPGGSSGGAGAAVASGIGHIAHGTDIAGSVRYPAYACGVHGLRPSVGRVAAYNASSPQRGIGPQLLLASGPLARCVNDLRIGLAAMSVGDPRDPHWVPAPLIGPALPRRAAICCYPDGLATAPEIVEELMKAAAALTDAGWQVEQVENLPPLREAAALQVNLWIANGYDKQLETAEREGDEGALTVLRGQREVASALTLDSLSETLTRRAVLVRLWQVFLDRYPVVLLPVSGELPFEKELDRKSDADFRRVWEAQMPQIGLPLIGVPALSLCTGKKGNTPLGVQIVAGRYREDMCLAAAEAIEQRVYVPQAVDPR